MIFSKKYLFLRMLFRKASVVVFGFSLLEYARVKNKNSSFCLFFYNFLSDILNFNIFSLWALETVCASWPHLIDVYRHTITKWQGNYVLKVQNSHKQHNVTLLLSILWPPLCPHTSPPHIKSRSSLMTYWGAVTV